MKVEIQFPASFTSDELLPIPIGRLQLGPYVARLVFCPDGNVRLAVDKAAIDNGYIKTFEVEDVSLTGFGLIPKKL